MAYSICKICGKEFYVKPSHQKLGWGKYCSANCRSKSQFNGKNVNCEVCAKSIYRSLKSLSNSRSKSGLFFCSKSCQTLWRNKIFKEENHGNWINGESAYRNILIRSGRVTKCLLCGYLDQRALSAHHIDHERTNNKVDNLTWLCLNCHYLVHHDRELDQKVRKSAK